MLRVEARNAQTPIERKPEWIRTTAKMGPEYTALHSMVKTEGLHTVCQEAGCPNIFECWEDKEATFLIGGDVCTRRCDFCDIATGRPLALDLDEPRRVAESVRQMGLRYSTVTGVARDDQPDGAASLYAETIRQIHALNPNTGVEILPPDFGAQPALVGQVFDARPEVFAHNLETVPRIFKQIRPAFTYDKSLRVLTMAREAELVTKSNLILGMGEQDHEVEQAIRDLHDAGCDILTITQYLRPSKLHHPIDRWVKPEEFVHWSAGRRGGRLQGRHGRTARAQLLPRRAALGHGHAQVGTPDPRAPPAPRGGRRRPGPPGGCLAAGRPAARGADPRLTTRILTPMARKDTQQSDTPKKPGRLAQVRQVFTAARKVDPTIPWWMLLAFLGTLLVGTGIGALVGHPWYALVLSIPMSMLAATIVLSRRAERAAYSSLEGQPGAAGAALQGLRRGWFYAQEPVAIDGARGTRPEDMVGAAFVYRAVGRPGIVLVAEGPTARRSKLLDPGAQEGRAGRPRRAGDAALGG